jgi:hypothetical protein
VEPRAEQSAQRAEAKARVKSLRARADEVHEADAARKRRRRIISMRLSVATGKPRSCVYDVMMIMMMLLLMMMIMMMMIMMIMMMMMMMNHDDGDDGDEDDDDGDG